MYQQELKKQLEEAFGANLNARQLWALTKFAKHVRLRARNNGAFNNLCNQLFPHARFSQVNKTRTNKYSGETESYPGLQIQVKDEVVAENESEE